MITRRAIKGNGHVKVTFAVEDDGRPVSVVGDFNEWDPKAHPLRRRSNGTRSVVVTLEKEQDYAFRYLKAPGVFFDDPTGDEIVDNGIGGTHTVVRL